MTPLVPSSPPNRIPLLAEMVATIRHLSTKIEEIGKDEETKIRALALCEIAVSVPPGLFTPDERISVMLCISKLYGDPFNFIRDLSNTGTSFVAKCPECGGKDIADILNGIYTEHKRMFGRGMEEALLNKF